MVRFVVWRWVGRDNIRIREIIEEVVIVIKVRNDGGCFRI